jgi:hypothetical protein
MMGPEDAVEQFAERARGAVAHHRNRAEEERKVARRAPAVASVADHLDLQRRPGRSHRAAVKAVEQLMYVGPPRDGQVLVAIGVRVEEIDVHRIHYGV